MKGAAKLWAPGGIVGHLKRDNAPICFDPCNNAQKQEVVMGSTPKLCALDSQFEIDYRACKDCITLAWGNRRANSKYTAIEIFKLERPLQYCASIAASNSLERLDASAQVSFLAFLSYYETPLATTESTPKTYSSLPTTTISRRLTTIASLTMMPTDSQTNIEPSGTNSNPTVPWTTIGTGVALGIVVLAIISTTAVFLLRRKRNSRKSKLKETPVLKIPTQGEDKPQLHSESFIRFELPHTIRRVPELLGLQKPRSELPIHEAELTAERDPLEVPAVEPVGLELPVEKTFGKV